ncbi:MAG TPA: efflux RND transporter periplasmic adaptor subunit [Pirellulales bacterium]|nr:efflux RND transporter periplasmic adaptor subunit [Pirellulales bacterium]
MACVGCGANVTADAPGDAPPPDVRIVKPQLRNITRVVGQPSFVESYERTSIFPKLSGYVEKWYVDIGDPVKKNQVLVDLFVPEIEEDYRTKKATVELDKQRVELAKKTVLVAKADVQAADARLTSTRAIWDRYDAQVVRWQSEVERLTDEVNRGVIDEQVLRESENQLKAATAARDASVAEIEKAEADLESKIATLHQDEVAVDVAEADVQVATSDWKRMEAWVGYLKLYAPYDGVVIGRAANTGDFVLPAKGDPTARARSVELSPSGEAAPVYVIDRTDVVRVFVDIPEHDANYVRAGSRATVLVKAFRDQPIAATVTRTSWALNVKSRTLRAEIDLPNVGSEIPTDLPESTRRALSEVRLPKTDTQILPGMYAYGKVIIERPHALALPASAIVYNGERAFCWIYRNGKAMRLEIQLGVREGKWVEVTNHLRLPADDAVQNVSLNGSAGPAGKNPDEAWVPFDGTEEVIVGNLAALSEGGPVTLASLK